MNKNFGGVIWTNHVLSRMRERGIKQGDAWAAFRRPDQTKYAKVKGAWVYYKTWSNQKMEVIAKQNVHKEWIILSVWSKPSSTRASPVYDKKSKPESFWKLIKRKIFCKRGS